MKYLIGALKRIIAGLDVTIGDIQHFENSSQSNVKHSASTLLDLNRSQNAEDVNACDEMLKMYSQVIHRVAKIIGPAPFLSKKSLLENMLAQEEFASSEKDYFPIVAYVGQNETDNIGILVYFDGKKELFEGNDEASDETLELVDTILGIGEKKVTVYGSHNKQIVDQIENTSLLPANLYISPDKKHAASYWGDDRILFSCLLRLKDVSQESPIDWRTRKETKIENFKLV